jgi:hypothetical protein
MFHDNLKTQTVEVMQYMWTNTWPDNLAPRIASLTLNQQRAVEHIAMSPGAIGRAEIVATDPDGDELNLSWELLPEPVRFGSYAGQGETKPKPVEGFITSTHENGISFRVPPQEQLNYRLFVYVRDEQGHVATANMPFHVPQQP